MRLGGYETDATKRALRAYKEASVAHMFANTPEGQEPDDRAIDNSIVAGLTAALSILHEAAAKDTQRLDWMERNPRMADIVVNGETLPCVMYAVSGAPGVKLREILDALVAAEKQPKATDFTDSQWEEFER